MEIFALDLGNKQTKLKSRKAEYVLPSQILNKSDMPQQLGSFGTRKISSYKVPFDENEWAWESDLAALKLDEYLQDTLMHQNRYQNDVFRLLANFALGKLATDFKEANKGIMKVIVVTGLPTDDYNSSKQLADLTEVLKGQHQVEVNGKTYTVRVEKVLIVPQPVGTFYDVLLDKQGYLKNEDLLEEKVGIIDVGGGTVLIDTLINFGLDKHNRKQYATGANDLYESIAAGIDGNASIYQIEKIVREGIKTREFAYCFSKNNVIDISDLVELEINSFTKRLVSNLKSTFKDIQTMDSLIITGGAANLINQRLIADTFETVTFVKDSEFANVRGFYKYALTKEGAEDSEEETGTTETD